MAITGKEGKVMVGGAKIAELDNWSLDLSADDVEVTNFDSEGWKEFLAGLKEWSGSISGNFVATDTAGQKALLNAWLTGTALSFTFVVASGIEFAGQAFVKPSIETPVDGQVTFSCDIQGTGPLTLPV